MNEFIGKSSHAHRYKSNQKALMETFWYDVMGMKEEDEIDFDVLIEALLNAATKRQRTFDSLTLQNEKQKEEIKDLQEQVKYDVERGNKAIQAVQDLNAKVKELENANETLLRESRTDSALLQAETDSYKSKLANSIVIATTKDEKKLLETGLQFKGLLYKEIQAKAKELEKKYPSIMSRLRKDENIESLLFNWAYINLFTNQSIAPKRLESDFITALEKRFAGDSSQC